MVKNYIPRKIVNYLHSFYVKNRIPTCVQISRQGDLISWQGRPHYYGLSHLVIGDPAVSQMPFLEGLLPIEQPEILEFVTISNGKSAHIHLVPVEENVWLLFLDASVEHEHVQKIQQQTYELSLLGYRYSQLMQALEITQQTFPTQNHHFEQVRILKNQLVTTLSKILHTSSLPETCYLELLMCIQKIEVAETCTLNSIENEIHHSLILISRILQQNQIDIEKLIRQPTICNIRELITDLESLFAAVVEEKGIFFNTRVDERVPVHLLLDELRFRQVLINLLNNAFKYRSQGVIELTLSWQENQLEFVVNDSGSGVDMEEQRELFASHPHKISTHFGMGLVASHHLVELMKGKLRVKSVPPLGAAFLGVVEAARVEFAFRDLPAQCGMEAVPERTAKILIVDEATNIRSLLRAYLEDENYEVVSASSCSEAMFVAWHTRPDLILMAMPLTTKTGYDVVKELQRQQFTRPIVALLNPEKDDKYHTLEVGCHLCLDKPLSKETLLNAVKQILKPA